MGNAVEILARAMHHRDAIRMCVLADTAVFRWEEATPRLRREYRHEAARILTDLVQAGWRPPIVDGALQG